MKTKPQRIELNITGITTVITEITKGYTKIYIERVYGSLWFYKDGLQPEEAIKIEAGKTYDLAGIVQIQKLNKSKSFMTLQAILS